MPLSPISRSVLLPLLLAVPWPAQADFTTTLRAATLRNITGIADDSVVALSEPALSGGIAAYRGTIKVGFSLPLVLFVNGMHTVGAGDPAPGSVSPFSSVGGVFVNGNGKVAFSGRADQEGMWTNATGSPALIAADDSPAPGTNGNFNLSQNAPISGFSDQGKVAFGALIQGAPPGSQAGLWMGLPDALELVARTGSPAADSPAGAEYRSIHVKPLLNSAGEIAFYTTTSEPVAPERSEGSSMVVLYAGKPGALKVIARTGDRAPETEGDIYLQPGAGSFGFNAGGAVAFRSRIYTAGPNPLGTGDAIYAGPRGQLRLVARTGFPAPDTELGTKFVALSDPALNASGEVMFLGQAQTAAQVTTEGIWAGRPGQLRLIARVGVTAPGTAQFFQYLTPLTISDSGQVAFRADLENAPNGQSSVLYATDETGVLRLIVRTGFPVLGSNPLPSFGVLPGSGGPAGNGDGRQVSFDAQGRIAFRGLWGGAASSPAFPGPDAIFVATPGTSAPVIPTTGQPASAGGVPGGRVEFQVTALGTRPATYQWKRGTTILTGETGPVLSLDALAAGDRGSYTVVVTNVHGSLESAPATLTLPPVIVTPPVSQSAGAGTSPQFSVGADGLGPLSYAWEFQPAGATGFSPLGVVTPTLTLTNVAVTQAGRYRVQLTNADGAVTSAETVLTVAPAGSVILEKIMLKGDRATGFPGEVFFSTGGLPVLNDSGEVAFDGGVQNSTGGLLDFGGAFGGTRDRLDIFHLNAGAKNLNDSGFAAMISNNLSFDNNLNNGCLTGPLGAVQVLAQEGLPAPGTSGTFAQNFAVSINDSGLAAFKHGTNDPQKPSGVYLGAPGVLTPVLFAGQQAPGLATGVNIQVLSAQVVLNNAGTVGFLANLTGAGITSANDEGVWLGTSAGAQRVIAESDAAPGAGAGAQFGSWENGRGYAMRINGAGQIAFANRLKGTGVDSSNDDAIFAGLPGALTLVAREGQTAGGFQFSSLVDAGPPPIINGTGQVAFAAYGGITFSQSIWRWTPGAGGGTKLLIAREGQQAPGLPAGVVFDSSDFGTPFFGFAMNGAGQIVFQSYLSGPGVEDANRNNRGLWMTNAAGEPKLIARLGDSLDVGGGAMKTLLDFVLVEAGSGSGGEDGLPRVLSSRGEVVFGAQVGNFQTNGIFRASFPASVPSAPFALTKPAAPVGQTTALLNGVVNPVGFSTTARFEYGGTTSYGQLSAVQTFPAGQVYSGVTASIAGLLPETTYHYRLVAANGNGTTPGEDRMFTTAAAEAQAFADWAAMSGLTGAAALPAADPDGDGQTNFFEFAFHGDPIAVSPAPQSGGLVSIGGQFWLTLSYRRWADRGAAGVIYLPQLFPPDAWTGDGIIDEVDPAAAVIAGSIAYRCRVMIDPVKSLQFLRVKASKP